MIENGNQESVKSKYHTARMLGTLHKNTLRKNTIWTVVGKSIQKIYQTDICLYSIFITGTQGEANSPFKEKV